MNVIACSDSRVGPATVFHAAPGEIFVLRPIAAPVPPCERDGGFIHQWVDIIAPIRDRPVAACPAEDRQPRLEYDAIRQSIDHFRTFPLIEAAERLGTLSFHGTHLDIRSRRLLLLDAGSNQFIPVDPNVRHWDHAT